MSLNSQVAYPEWVTRIATTSTDEGYAIARDGSNNIYVAGRYTGAATSNVTSYDSSGNVGALVDASGFGSDECFLTKYNAAGLVQWSTRIVSTGSDYGYGLACDGSNNVIITGICTGTTSIYNADRTVLRTLDASGSGDWFIAKYSGAGVGQWATRIAGVNADTGRAIATDSAGAIYVAGDVSGSGAVAYNQANTAGGTLTNAGGADAYLIKYNAAGAYQWAVRVATANADQGYGVACDVGGNVYMTGTYTSTAATFYSASNTIYGSITNAGSSEAFLMKVNTSGTIQWTTRIASTGADVGLAITTDSASNVIVAGYQTGTTTIFNSGGASFGTLDNSGGTDGFVVKYNTSGTAQWSARISTTSADQINAVACDASNNVYVAGQYIGTPLTLYNANKTAAMTMTNQDSATNTSAFMVKYDSAGTVIYGAKMDGGGANSISEFYRGVVIDTNFNVYVIGNSTTNSKVYDSSGYLSNFPLVTNSPMWYYADSGSDVVVIKYGQVDATTYNTAYADGYNLGITGSTSPNGAYSANATVQRLYLQRYYDGYTTYMAAYNAGRAAGYAAGYNISLGKVYDGKYTNAANPAGYSATASLQTIYTAGYNAAYTLGQANASKKQLATPSMSVRVDGSGNEQALGVLADNDGSFYMAGNYSAGANIVGANGSGYTYPISGSTSSTIVKYDSTGMPMWRARVTASNDTKSVGITMDATNIYVLGTYSNTATFYNGVNVIYPGTETSAGSLTTSNTDVYLISYRKLDGGVNWFARMGGVAVVNDDARAIVKDSGTGLYVAMNTQGGSALTAYNSNAAGGAAFSTAVPSAGNNETYIVKYNTSGVGQWVARIGGTGSDIPYSIACDSADNVYVAGTVSTSALIYDSSGLQYISGIPTSLNQTGSFIVKFNSSGKVQWMNRFNGNSGTTQINGLAIDGSNNLYITGYYNNAIFLSNADGTLYYPQFTNSNVGNQSNDGFLVKYNSSGFVQWATRIASGASDYGASIKCDSANNIYIVGMYYEFLSVFNANTSVFTTLYNIDYAYDIYLVKYDSDGSAIYAANMGTRTVQNISDTITALSLDLANNIYIAGHSNGKVSAFDSENNNILTIDNSGSGTSTSCSFVVKYSQLDAATYSTSYNAGYSAALQASAQDMAYSGNQVAYNAGYKAGVAELAAAYIAGEDRGLKSQYNVITGKTALAAQTYDTNTYLQVRYTTGYSDGQSAAVSYYQTNRQVAYPVWTAHIGSSASDDGAKITRDAANNLYITSLLGSQASIYHADGTIFKTFDAAGSNDTYIAKYNSAGRAQWAARIASTGSDSALHITCDSMNVYITGFYNAALTAFNSNDVAGGTLALATGPDTFIIAYNMNTGNIAWVNRMTSASSDNGRWLEVDNNNRLYVAGDFANTLTIYNGGGLATWQTLTASNAGTANGVMVVYDTLTGSPLHYVYTKTTNNTTASQFTGVFYEPTANRIFLVAQYTGYNLNIYAANSQSTVAKVQIPFYQGISCYVIIAYDMASGTPTYAWDATIGASSVISIGNIAVDKTGSFYVAGQMKANSNLGYLSQLTINPGTNASAAPKNYNYSITAPSTTGSGTYLVKFLASDGSVQWVTRATTTSTTGMDNQAVACDASGNVYMSGGFNNSTTFFNQDTTACLTLTAADTTNNDGYVVKYDPSGMVLWANQVGGVSGKADASKYVQIASDNSVYLVVSSASNAQTANIYDSTGVALMNAGSNEGGVDAYIIEYGQTDYTTYSTTYNAGYNAALQAQAKNTSYSADANIQGLYNNAYALGQAAYNTAYTAGKTVGYKSGYDVVMGLPSTAASSTYSTNVNLQAAYTAGYSAGLTVGTSYGSSRTVAVPQWMARTASSGAEQAYTLARDSQNNIYVAMYTSGQTSICNQDGSIYTVVDSSGGTDAFLVKYNPAGAVLWYSRVMSTSNDIGFGVVCDAADNVYFTGEATSGARILNADGSTYSIMDNSGSVDAFLIEYNSAGAVQWVARVGGTAQDSGRAVAVDSQLNVYMSFTCNAGTPRIFSSNNTILGGAALGNAGGYDTYVAKFNSSGIAQWYVQVGGANTEAPAQNTLAVDPSDNIYMASQVGNPPFLAYNANRTIFLNQYSNLSANDGFIAKINSSGTFQWINRIASTGSDIINAVCCDKLGNVYAVGQYTGTYLQISNSDGTLYTPVLDSNSIDGLIVKYNSAGMVQWANRIGNATSAGEAAWVVACDNNNNVYVTAEYGYLNVSSLPIYNSDRTTYLSLPVTGTTSNNESALIKYDPSGFALWATLVSTVSATAKYPKGLIIDGSNNIYMSHYTSSMPIVYDSALAKGLTAPFNEGSSDAWLIKYSDISYSIYSTAYTAGYNAAIRGQARNTSYSGNQFIYNYAYSNGKELYDTAYAAGKDRGYKSGFTVATGGSALASQTYSSNPYLQAAYTKAYAVGQTAGTNYGTTRQMISPQWVARVGGSGDEVIANAIARDSQNNIIAGFYYTSNPLTIISADGAFVTTYDNSGNSDSAVVKTNSAGIVQWSARIYGTGNEYIREVACDAADNIVATVETTTAITVLNSNGTVFGTVANAGNADTVVIKYNSAGTVQWTARVAGTSNDYVGSIATDSQNNIYVSSHATQGALTIYNADTSTFAANIGTVGQDALIVKYNSSGVAQSYIRISSAGTENIYAGQSLVCDSADNLYVIGQYAGTITVFNANATQTFYTGQLGSSDAFVIKFNSSGVAQWFSRIGSTAADAGYVLCVDNNNNLYAYVGYQGTVYVHNADGSVFGTYTNAGSTDCLTIRYTASTGAVQWVSRIGGTGNDVALSYLGIACDASGNSYVSGTTQSASLIIYNADQTSSYTIATPSGTNRSGYLVKYDSSGIAVGIAYSGASGQNSDMRGMVLGTNNDIYMCLNTYNNTTYVYDSSGAAALTVPTSGNNESYILKLEQSTFSAFTTAYGLGYTAGLQNQAKNTSYSATAFIQKNYGAGYDAGYAVYNAAYTAGKDRGFKSGYNDANGLATLPSQATTYTTDTYLRTVYTAGYNAGVSAGLDYGSARTAAVPTWYSRIDSTGSSDNMHNVARDAQNNIYMAIQQGGSNRPAIFINSENYSRLVDTSSNDTLIIKYSPTGSITWLARIYGTGTETSYSITTDSAGNVYVSGDYTSTTTFQNADGTAFATTLANAGSNDVYVAKYNGSTGAVMWATRIAGTGSDGARGLATDSNNNVYVGCFINAAGTVVYNSGGSVATTLAYVASTDAALVKFNSSGTYQWAVRVAGTGADFIYQRNIVCDTSDNIYFSGSYGAGPCRIYNADLSLSMVQLVTAQGQEGYVAKVNSSGYAQWAIPISATGSDTVNGIAIDGNNNLYVATKYSGLCTIYNADRSIYKTVSQIGSDDVIIIKYNAAGQAQWTSTIGGSESDNVNGISTDSAGNIYVAGTYRAVMRPYNADGTNYYSLTNADSTGVDDAYVVKYDPSGTVMWTINLAVKSRGDSVNSTLIDGSGSIYVYGGTIASKVFDSYGREMYTLGVEGVNTTGSYIIKYQETDLPTYNQAYDDGYAVGVAAGSADSGYSYSSAVQTTYNNAYKVGLRARTDATIAGKTRGFLGLSGEVYSAVATLQGLYDAGYAVGLVNGPVKAAANQTVAYPSALIRAGSTGADAGMSVAKDSQNNIYVVGYYATQFTIYNPDGTVNSVIDNSGGNDTYLAKYDSSNVLQWKLRIAGTANENTNIIKIDASDNVYIKGDYTSNPATFYNSDGSVFKTLTNGGSSDAFVAKYSTSGTGAWVIRLDGTGNEFMNSGMAIDANQNVYFNMTSTSASTTFYNADDTLAATNVRTLTDTDGFLVKYNSAGTYVWHYRVSGIGTETFNNSSVALDSAGAVYFCGSYGGTPTTFYNVDGSVYATYSMFSSTNGFIAKVSAAGATQWISQIKSSIGANINSVAVDGSNNVYAFANAGRSPVTLYNVDGSLYDTLYNEDDQDSYIIRYNSAGAIQWVSRIGGTGADTAQNIYTDAAGYIYVAGTTASLSTKFYNSDGTYSVIKSSVDTTQDAYIARYSPDGFYNWMAYINGVTGVTELIRSIVVAGDGAVYVVGNTNAESIFYDSAGNKTYTFMNDTGTDDALLVRYDMVDLGQYNTAYTAGYNAGAADQARNTSYSGTALIQMIYNRAYTNATEDRTTAYNAGKDRGYKSAYAQSVGQTGLSGETYSANQSIQTFYNSGYSDGLTSGAYYGAQRTIFNPLWYARAGNSGTDTLLSIAIDSQNNLYGGHAGGGGTATSSIFNSNGTLFKSMSNTTNDSYLVKYNSSGIGQWATRFASPSNDYINGIITDSAGNVYACGSMSATAAGTTVSIRDLSDNAFTTFTSLSGDDFVVVKYAANGTGLWAARLGGTANDAANKMAVDSAGNLYVVGYIGANVATVYNANGTQFGSTITSLGSNDAIVVKYNSAGAVQWVGRFATTGDDRYQGITCDSADNIYLTGQYAALGTIYNTNGSTYTTTFKTFGGSDAMLVKINSAGTVQWTASIGSTSSEQGNFLKCDTQGNVYLCGIASNNAIIYNADGSRFATKITSGGTYDAILMKFSSAGACEWYTRVSSTNDDTALELDIDASGAIYIGGSFKGPTLTFHNADYTSYTTMANTETTSSNVDGYVVKYDASGMYLGHVRVGGIASKNETVRGARAATDGTIYVAGYSDGLSYVYDSFGTTKFTLSSIGGVDAFYLKYEQDTITAYNSAYTAGYDAGFSNAAQNTSYSAKTFIQSNYDAGYAAGLLAYRNAYYAGLSRGFSSGFATGLSGEVYSANASIQAIYDGAYATGLTRGTPYSGNARLMNYPLWVTRIASSGNEYANNLARDSQNNVYVVGSIAGSANIYDSSRNLVSTIGGYGSDDCYIVKYSKTGQLLWKARIVSTGADAGYGVACDSADNVYVTGIAGDTTIVEHGDGTTYNTISAIGAGDWFLVKYNSAGVVQWDTSIAGTGVDTGRSLAVDSAGSVYVIGDATGIDVMVYNSDGSTYGTGSALVNNGAGDVYVVKYNSVGIAQWVVSVSSSNADTGYNIACDMSDNIYICGTYSTNPVSFYDVTATVVKTLNVSSSTALDGFLAKYNSAGTLLWASYISNTNVAGTDYVYSLDTDLVGNVYIAGSFSATAGYSRFNFYDASGTASAFSLTAAGNTDGYIAKYSPAGTPLWAASITGAAFDSANSVTVDASSNVYVTGVYQGTPVTFYNNDGSAYFTLTNTDAATYNDAYVARYDPTGVAVWVSRIGGVAGVTETALKVTIDGEGSLYALGTSTGPSKVYDGAGVAQFSLGNEGGADTFLVKYTQFSITSYNNAYAAGYAVGIANGVYNTSYSENSVVQGVYRGGYDAGLAVYNNAYTAGKDRGFKSGYAVAVGLAGLSGEVYSADATLQSIYNGAYATGVAQGTAYGSSRQMAAPVWANNIGGASSDENYGGLCRDGANNVYITSRYSEAINVYNKNGTVFKTLDNLGGTDFCVTKYDTSGQPLWAAAISSTGDEYATGAVCDASNNVYITAYTKGAAAIYNADDTLFTTLNENADPINPTTDWVIVKYSAAGAVAWATYITGTGSSQGRRVCTDSAGNLYVIGDVAGSNVVIFNSDGTQYGAPLTNSGGSDAYVIKFNQQGFGQWVARIATTGDDSAYGIACDGAGNVIVIGSYANGATATVYNANGTAYPTTLKNEAGTNAYVVKYSSAGSVVWITSVDGQGYVTGYAVACDSANNVYVTGQGGADDPILVYSAGASLFSTIPNSGNNDAFLVKYNSAGAGVWATRVAGAGVDVAYCVDVDSAGNSYVTGAYNGSPVTFYNADKTGYITLSNVDLSNNYDSFVAKYDASGFALWAASIGGLAGGNEYGRGVLVDGSNNLYVAGYSDVSSNVYNSIGGASLGLLNYGGSDVFLIKYEQDTFANYSSAYSTGYSAGSTNQALNQAYSVKTFIQNAYALGHATGLADYTAAYDTGYSAAAQQQASNNGYLTNADLQTAYTAGYSAGQTAYTTSYNAGYDAAVKVQAANASYSANTYIQARYDLGYTTGQADYLAAYDTGYNAAAQGLSSSNGYLANNDLKAAYNSGYGTGQTDYTTAYNVAYDRAVRGLTLQASYSANTYIQARYAYGYGTGQTAATASYSAGYSAGSTQAQANGSYSANTYLQTRYNIGYTKGSGDYLTVYNNAYNAALRAQSNTYSGALTTASSAGYSAGQSLYDSSHLAGFTDASNNVAQNTSYSDNTDVQAAYNLGFTQYSTAYTAGYNAGYLNVSNNTYTYSYVRARYTAGYNVTNALYTVAYNDGYSTGLSGSSSNNTYVDAVLIAVYNTAYSAGARAGAVVPNSKKSDTVIQKEKFATLENSISTITNATGLDTSGNYQTSASFPYISTASSAGQASASLAQKLRTIETTYTPRTYVDQRISTLVSGAPVVLDKLSELATSLANNPAFYSTIVQSTIAERDRSIAAIGVLSTLNSTEAAAAATQQGLIQADISAETSRAMTAEASISTAIAGQAPLRQAQVSSVTQTLANQTNLGSASDDLLNSELTAQISQRQTDVATLNVSNLGQINSTIAGINLKTDAETSTSVAFLSTVSSNLYSEVLRATASTNTISSRVTAHISSSIGNDSTIRISIDTKGDGISTLIAAETARAKSAEQGLSTALRTKISTATAIVGGLITGLSGEIVRAGQAEQDISGAVRTLVSSEAARALTTTQGLSTALGLETARAQTGETSIAGAISLQSTTARVAEQDISGAVRSLLTTENGRAVLAEQGLSTSLATEVSRATGAETDLTSSIVGESVRAIASMSTISAAVHSLISTEQSRATLAEQGLSTSLASEVSRATGAETDLTSSIVSESSRAAASMSTISAAIHSLISTEQSRATLAEQGLSTGLAQETARSLSTISSFTSTLGAEIARAQLRETDISNSLQAVVGDDETVRATAAEQAISTAITAETSRATGAESALTSTINGVQAIISTFSAVVDTEQSGGAKGFTGNYIQGLSTIKSAVEALDSQLYSTTSTYASLQYVDQRISTLINGASSILNTLNEINTALNNDPAFASTLISTIAVETGRATAAEADISGALATEVGRAQLAEAGLTSTLTAEVARAGIAEQDISGAIYSAISTASGLALVAEADISSNIASEVSRATGAETVLTSTLVAEVSRVGIAEQDISGAAHTLLAAEISRATTAQQGLSTNLAAEISRATAAETALTSTLTAETTRSIVSIQDISGALRTLISAEETRSISTIGSISTALGTESARALLAEQGLSTGLGSETSRALASLGDISGSIRALIPIEESRAVAAEQLVSTAIVDETVRAQAAELTITGNVAVEISRAQTSEQDISGATRLLLSNEIVRATDVETDISGRLQTEVSRATTAEQGLTSTLAGTYIVRSGYGGQTSISTVGTISTGTWLASTVAASQGGTGFTSYSKGDLLVGSASNGLDKLAVGTAAYALKASSDATATWSIQDASSIVLTSAANFTGASNLQQALNLLYANTKTRKVINHVVTSSANYSDAVVPNSNYVLGRVHFINYDANNTTIYLPPVHQNVSYADGTVYRLVHNGDPETDGNLIIRYRSGTINGAGTTITGTTYTVVEIVPRDSVCIIWDQGTTSYLYASGV